MSKYSLARHITQDLTYKHKLPILWCTSPKSIPEHQLHVMAGVLEYFSSFRVLFILSCVYVLFKLTRFGSREKHLPPGPPTYPIVGNAHLVVDKDLYKRFRSISSPSRTNF